MFRTRFSAAIIASSLAFGATALTAAPAGAVASKVGPDGVCRLSMTSTESDLFRMYNPRLPLGTPFLPTEVHPDGTSFGITLMGNLLIKAQERAVSSPMTSEDKAYVALLTHLQAAYKACAAEQSYDSVAVEKARKEAAAKKAAAEAAKKAAAEAAARKAQAEREAAIREAALKEGREAAAKEAAAKEAAAKAAAAKEAAAKAAKLDATKAATNAATDVDVADEGTASSESNGKSANTALAIGGAIASLVAVIAAILPYYAHALPAGMFGA